MTLSDCFLSENTCRVKPSDATCMVGVSLGRARHRTPLARTGMHRFYPACRAPYCRAADTVRKCSLVTCPAGIDNRARTRPLPHASLDFHSWLSSCRARGAAESGLFASQRQGAQWRSTRANVVAAPRKAMALYQTRRQLALSQGPARTGNADRCTRLAHDTGRLEIECGRYASGSPPTYRQRGWPERHHREPRV
jgi:hypothetical protein